MKYKHSGATGTLYHGTIGIAIPQLVPLVLEYHGTMVHVLEYQNVMGEYVFMFKKLTREKLVTIVLTGLALPALSTKAFRPTTPGLPVLRQARSQSCKTPSDCHLKPLDYMSQN